MSNVVHFNFRDHDVRVQNQEGEPWFVLSDVCRILELSTPAKAASRLCPKGMTKTHTLTNGGKQEVVLIDEPNLYRLIFRSNKPEAEKFQRWVFEEVLPMIRKTGGYKGQSISGGETVTISKDDYISFLELQIDALKPKRRSIPDEERHDILRALKAGMRRSDIARQFSRPQETIDTIERRAKQEGVL